MSRGSTYIFHHRLIPRISSALQLRVRVLYVAKEVYGSIYQLAESPFDEIDFASTSGCPNSGHQYHSDAIGTPDFTPTSMRPLRSISQFL